MIPRERNKKPGEIELQMEDVEIIMGDDFKHFDMITDSAFCARCSPAGTSIAAYKIYLNDLEDIILRGSCSQCGSPVARYIETGESKLKAEIANHIRMIKKKFKVKDS